MGPFRAFVIDSHVSRGGRLWSADRPRAQLGLARAYAAEGDGENGRKAYEDFFTTGKDADPDIPYFVGPKPNTRNSPQPPLPSLQHQGKTIAPFL